MLQENANYEWKYYPHDKSGYLTLKDGKVDNTLVLVEGHIMLDRNRKGEILRVEILLTSSQSKQI